MTRSFLIVILVVAVCGVPFARAGDSLGLRQFPGDNAGPQFGGRQNQPTPEEQKRQHEMEKERNKERQQKLKQDTDKLLQLATELKTYVDKTNENILSVDVLKKTDEIEKLAKSIHDKMKAENYAAPFPSVSSQ